MNSAVLKQNPSEQAGSLHPGPLPPPLTSLSGIIEFGSVPSVQLCPAAATTWPSVIRVGAVEIAIDGHFVIGDRLYVGRTRQEREQIGEWARADLRALLARIQNGFFNIVVNDHERGETRFCNDPYGGLPLYIAREPDRILFAATYAGLRSQGLRSLDVDPIGAAELYWVGYQLGERTALRNVRLLPPGSELTIRWRDGESRVEEIPACANGPPVLRSLGEAAEHVVASMRAACRRLHRPDVGTGIKVSGGMDSRLICGTWPDNSARAYTYGHPRAAEVSLARQLARALGMQHTFIPLQGDFFTQLHAPLFPLHGITEFFHQAALPAMQRDGVRLVLDGLAGDGVVGGLWSRHGQSRWRQALGLAAADRETLPSDEAMAEYIFRNVRVPDAHYRPVLPDVRRDLQIVESDILHDLVQEVRRAKARFATFDGVYTDVIFRNRTRRYIALQGTFCRPYVETLYPFLDREMLALRGALRLEWLANKRLYVEIYTRHMPAIRSVPGLFSLLPFTVPASLHFPGRAVRYGIEQVGLRISYGTRNRVHPWASNGVQWARWLAFNDAFREGARAFMRDSAVYDDPGFRRDMREVASGPRFSATRFMLTASYCGHFRGADSLAIR
jgi:asparagine synthetase B (glutamine-hydrolysing)